MLMLKPTNIIVPGYTFLTIDTNVLLSSLSMFASLMERLRWTVIIPLPVIMEFDDFNDWDSWVRNMDDLILRVAIWDDKRWFDRSGLPCAFSRRACRLPK